MNPLSAALKDKFGTPEKALAALGLEPTLLAADGSATPTPKRTPKMAKLNATALAVRSALIAHLGPKLAADAALPDLTPALAGITRSTLGKSKAKVWAAAKQIVKPVLAADQAGPDDVAIRILDMIDKQGASEMEGAGDPAMAEADQTRDEGMQADPDMVTDPNAAVVPAAKKKPMEMKPGEEPPAEDDEDGQKDAEILRMLKEKLGDDALAQECMGIMKGAGGAKDEVVAPGKTEVPKTDTAEDEEEAPMMKPAMDAAIKAAVLQSQADMRAEARGAQEARAFVRPWVGEVSIAFDTAEEIYKATLEARGVKTKGIHPSAYRSIIQHMPKPGSKTQLAQDGALPSGGGKSSSSDLSKRFPHAANIRVMG